MYKYESISALTLLRSTYFYVPVSFCFFKYIVSEKILA